MNRYNGSAIVPPQAQLDWPVDLAFLSGGAVYSIASTTRNMTHTFLGRLFDDASTCTENIDTNLRVCWKPTTGTSWTSVNPWTLGYWNP